MKLRNKIIIAILFSLFLQVIISGSFVIITFINQSRKSDEKELISNWEIAKFYFEKLKNLSLTDISNIKEYTSNNNSNNTNSIITAIKLFGSNSNSDRICIIDNKRKIIADNIFKQSDLFINEIINSYHFAFPSNRFFCKKDNSGNYDLYLITGTWIYQSKNSIKKYAVFFIKKIDEFAINQIGAELDIELAIFAGDKFICSTIPPFKLSEKNIPQKMQLIQTTTGSYYIYDQILSSDFKEGINLVVLKSRLEYSNYIHNIINSFIIAFCITLLISTLLAISMTAFFTYPFIKLQKWLNLYMKKKELTSLNINQKDDIGFLATSFYKLATKLIKDEAIIKKNLKKISFLNKYNENILQNLQSGVLVINSKGIIEYCNNFLYNLLGSNKTKIISSKFSDFFNKYFKIISNNFNLKQFNFNENKQIENIIFKNSSKDTLKFTMKIIPLTDSNQETNALVLLEDITKIEKFWEKMIQAEKIFSLGLLSAGMAHEINNPLSSILSHVQFLSTVEKDNQKLDSLKWIEEETKRIAEIVQKLLNFGRSDGKEEDFCEINSIILELIDLLKLEFKKREIIILKKLESNLPKIKLSSQQAKQIILNLLLNSIYAINKEGEIKIITKKKDNIIECLMIDNGIGISKKDIKYIFDPFFTTKSEVGTGLGLSICYSITKKAGGDISVESFLNKGTTMRIIFPVKE